MSASPKPRVEPLSRPAWERVEAQLFERLERGEHLTPARAAAAPRRAARLWMGVAAFAAAAAVAVWWQAGSPEALPIAQPTRIEPPLQTPPGSNGGTHIVTSSAPTRTTIGEAALTLAAASEAHVTGSDAAGWLVRLDRGQVDCEVAPRGARPPFVVEAGETKVTVVGTRFSVVRDGASAIVVVREGHVRVASGAQQALLGPGESWPAEPAAEQPAPEPAEDPSPSLPDEASDQRRSRSARTEFARAARLEASDSEAALGIYQRLARGKGPWAANALYAQARLELERGERTRARRLLRTYLTRHPSGANGSDVRALLQRLEADRP